MSAALGTWSALEQSKIRRVEGHTSNVESQILYSQFIKGTIGETTEAGDTYIIPHKFKRVQFISASPLDTKAKTALYGNGTTEGCFFDEAASVAGPTQITTAAAAGATTVVLTSGSAIDDVYNGCFVEITFSNGNTQVVKITDYVGATTTATLETGLASAIGTSGAYYTIRGTLMTIASAAVTPKIGFEVLGYFE